MKLDKKQRRNFLKAAFVAIATIGLATVSKRKSIKTEGKKIKMLTPDGKLVEVDEAIIAQAGQNQIRATNMDVKQWMASSKITKP
jgi:hypothetical protein